MILKTGESQNFTCWILSTPQTLPRLGPQMLQPDDSCPLAESCWGSDKMERKDSDIGASQWNGQTDYIVKPTGDKVPVVHRVQSALRGSLLLLSLHIHIQTRVCVYHPSIYLHVTYLSTYLPTYLSKEMKMQRRVWKTKLRQCPRKQKGKTDKKKNGKWGRWEK